MDVMAARPELNDVVDEVERGYVMCHGGGADVKEELLCPAQQNDPGSSSSPFPGTLHVDVK